MALSKHFEAEKVENKWYKHWKESGYFKSTPDEREPFSIVIPPPNVTGILHMGHMLNNTIQDILIRQARLDGKNACWVPGTDHASIATEAKVVKMLREQGIKKSDLTREKFLEYAWEWKEKYGGIILSQLEKLGASCDWDRTAFTMDPTRTEGVIKAFVDLYNKGTLYRGLRMVNWDPAAQTVLSNEEVLYNDEQSNLYHVKYQIEGTDDFLTIATTRPETILGDSAIAVNPSDERYTHLKNKRAIVPLINRSVPIIFDDYVEMEFGTGALKVTPAHDVNDYEIGKRHGLEVIDILNDDGSLSEAAQLYVGQDRFEVRPQIVKQLKEIGQIDKIESYMHSVGRSERTNAVVEPKLSLQWYVDMKKLCDPALQAVKQGDIQLFPEKFKNTYNHWLENIRDWCISRQLWWGQRIPAYYIDDEVIVANTPEMALEQAREKMNNPNLEMSDLKQDEDVLDTWFSSWLWPITVFNGFNTKEEIDYYYPTQVLVTGWDIIFLWVARMIMAGYEWKNEKPFNHVYFTGMVRDKQRRKMSKQLGNSPDALKLIQDFGADGVRFGMMSCSPAGGDLLFDEKYCEQGRNFCNKLWNVLKLIKGWEVDTTKSQADINKLATNWIRQKMYQTIEQLKSDYDQYRLSEALINLYSFIWNDFCSWYLEMIKPPFGEAIDSKTLGETIDIFEDLMIILHPFMPFITEEIYGELKERSENDNCIIAKMPNAEAFDKSFVQDVNIAHDLITKIREQRVANGIKMKEPLNLSAESNQEINRILNHEGMRNMINKMAFLNELEVTEVSPKGKAFISGKTKFVLDINQSIDVEAERSKLEEEKERLTRFKAQINGKLSNERFVNNAPAAVVEKERRKLADTTEKLANIEDLLANLA